MEKINWDKSGILLRIAVVELCGWKNIHGQATPIGKRIARTNWALLTPAAKRILQTAGIEE